MSAARTAALALVLLLALASVAAARPYGVQRRAGGNPNPAAPADVQEFLRSAQKQAAARRPGRLGRPVGKTMPLLAAAAAAAAAGDSAAPAAAGDERDSAKAANLKALQQESPFEPLTHRATVAERQLSLLRLSDRLKELKAAGDKLHFNPRGDDAPAFGAREKFAQAKSAAAAAIAASAQGKEEAHQKLARDKALREKDLQNMLHMRHEDLKRQQLRRQQQKERAEAAAGEAAAAVVNTPKENN